MLLCSEETRAPYLLGNIERGKSEKIFFADGVVGELQRSLYACFRVDIGVLK